MDTHRITIYRTALRNAFNGATASQPWIPREPVYQMSTPRFLQWSHGLSAMDTMSLTCWISSGVSLQWSHGLSAMDTVYMPGLVTPCLMYLQWSHGLSAMDTLRIEASFTEQFKPSMEPRPLSHGYLPKPLSKETLNDPFNGATASQPWIPARRPRQRVAATILQWSHGLSAMDTKIAAGSILPDAALQWSHGLSAMDTPTRVGLIYAPSMILQWSHGLSAMDTKKRTPRSGPISDLQWSHGLSAMDT